MSKGNVIQPAKGKKLYPETKNRETLSGSIFRTCRGLFFVHFSAVVTLGLSQNPRYRRTLEEIFCYFSALFSEMKRKKKIRENPEKKTCVSPIFHAWETNGNRINTGVLAEEQQKKKRRKPGRKRTLYNNQITLENTIFSLSISRFIQKKKRRKSEKWDDGKGKEKGAKMRSGLADGGRPEGK